MLNKIKKWHIAIIIVVGIGVFWLSNNMWVFEKQISVEKYENHLTGTEWESDERAVIWNLHKDKKFIEKSNWYEDDEASNGVWEIKNDTLITHTYFLPNAEWKIIRLSEKEMIIRLINLSPGVKYKFIKIS